jgi:Sec-independent protein translocase protein TatA
MTLFEVVLAVVLTIAVVIAILLFERRRAQQIERDVGEMARERRRRRDEPPR